MIGHSIEKECENCKLLGSLLNAERDRRRSLEDKLAESKALAANTSYVPSRAELIGKINVLEAELDESKALVVALNKLANEWCKPMRNYAGDEKLENSYDPTRLTCVRELRAALESAGKAAPAEGKVSHE